MRNRLNRNRRAVLISCLLEEMDENESWCGETHIQKGVYFLQEVMEIPLEFPFVPYKHGPFSFELRNELTAMRAKGLLRLEFEGSYGPRFKTTERIRNVRPFYKQTLQRHQPDITFIARELGGKWVSELERLATALFVTRLEDGVSQAKRAEKVSELKQHIPKEKAEKSVAAIDVLLKKVANQRLAI